MNPDQLPVYQILDTWVNPLNISDLNALIAYAVTHQQRWVIANHNLHSLYLYYHDPKMQKFYAKADYIHVDGMPLIWLGKRLGYPLRREHRVTYADWNEPLIAEAAKQGWRVFYLGSKPGVAERGALVLREKFPSLQMATAHGYFNSQVESEENQTILAQIQSYQPQVLMVGMSMPRQEHWILDNLEQLPVNAILPAGAAIDYIAGAVPTPPRWAGKLGLEWLFRLISEPKRLWQRYLVEPWFILGLLLIRKFSKR